MTLQSRVLVIDDDDALRSAFARVLIRDGYSVQVAATAEEALNRVAQDRPHAILLDLKMPMINGVGFLYRLRANPANRDIRVALITGERTLDNGTVDDLSALSARVWHKPLSLEDVRQVARTLLPPDQSETAAE